MAEDTMPFVWGSGGAKDSPRRRLAEALLKSGTSSAPVGHWVQGLARIGDAISGQWELNKEDAARQKSNDALAKAFEGYAGAQVAGAVPQVGSSGGVASPVAVTGAQPKAVYDGLVARGIPSIVAAGMAGNFHGESGFNTGAWGDKNTSFGLGQWRGDRLTGLKQLAAAQGKDPSDLNVQLDHVVNELQGPESKAFQMASAAKSPEDAAWAIARHYERPAEWALAKSGPVRASYARGVFDKFGGGAPVAAADLPAQGASPVALETPQPGFAIPPAAGAPQMTGATFDQITNGMGSQPLDPVFQTEGASQPWMGTALQPAQPDTTTQIAQALSQTMPPPRPADLAMPQADLPAPGAAQAMGQLPVATSPQPIIADPTKDNAGVLSGLVASEEQRQGQQSGAGITSPFSGIAQALSTSPAASPAPAGDSVFTKLAGALGGSPATPAPVAAPPGLGGAPATPAAASNPMMGLAAALIRSGNVKEGVAIAQDVMKPANGVQIGDRLVDPRTGRVIADFSQANGGRSNEFGLQPIYGVGPDGKPVIMQLGKRGDATATKMPDGVSLARDPIKVDGPTGTTLLDPQTRQPVGFIPKEIAQAKVEEAKGTAQGAGIVGLPTAIAQANQMLKTIDTVRNHPGRNDLGATGASADWPIIGGGLGGTKARDFVGAVEQLKGKSFLEAFNSLKGAGAISEIEGAKATSAIARLDRAQSKEGFDAALNDLEEVVRNGVASAQQKAGVKPQDMATVPKPSPAPNGDRAALEAEARRRGLIK